MQRILPVALVALVLAAAPVRSADDYTLDTAHSGVVFKISHLGLSWTQGRFNDVAGSFALDADPAKCSFSLTIKAESIDEAKAEEARQRAEARLHEKLSAEEVATVNASLARSLAQLRVKRRRQA